MLLKVEISKKRAIESAVKTPGPDKKAKLTTPQKTGYFLALSAVTVLVCYCTCACITEWSLFMFWIPFLKYCSITGVDGKKGSGHVATPHPAKQAGKNKNQQTPKSGGGSHSCKTCSR